MPGELGKQNLVTLTRFIQKNPNLDAQKRDEFALLFSAIQLASKIVGNSMKRAGIEHQFGLSGTINVHGEEVKKLDLIANDAFKEALVSCEQVAVMASEEEEECVIVDEQNAGKYILTFDPLDGSSNIDANVSVGSIFGIYSKKSEGKTGHTSDCLQAGRELVASGYSIYGSAIILVLSMGVGVNGFTFDPSLGEFVLSHPDIKIPEKGAIYSVNEGNSSYWPKATYEYVQFCKSEDKATGKKPYSARYIGSMVADVHRTLLYGGIFMYPADSKSPNGKLRYLYEVAPLSYIVEKAGGLATTGTQRCLDIVPDKVHLRVPVFMGSKQQVLDVEEFFKKYPESK
eukprot:TRINITY_DN844_c0_g1_i1.p1 TRINITY_DN844_c0_g1~~TRINITY_DN844_c0_g1_i1.p1  ORF type:complete len:343 (+),score=138.82 TRINITY_DN844_c0_g1_i1:140-1168(+)